MYRPFSSELIERQAEALFLEFSDRDGALARPPVPVYLIAEHLLGVCLKTYEAGKTQEPDLRRGRKVGLLLPKEGLIAINQHCPTPLSRFTVAHEIGHWLLHVEKEKQRLSTKRSNRLSCFLHSTRIKDQRKKARYQEMEANQFAAALLMPRSLLSTIAQTYSHIDTDAISRLADVFDVSRTAMLFRVKNLWRNSNWDGPPIDLQSLVKIEMMWNKSYKHDIQQVIREKLTKLGFSAVPIDMQPQPSDKKLLYRCPRWVKDHKYIIELAGCPNGGKDTQIEILVHYLRSVGYRVVTIEEGFKACPLIGRSHFQKLQWAISFTTEKLLQYGLDYEHDIVILNRGPFDFLGLLRFWSGQHVISKDEERKLAHLLLTESADWIDTVFLLEISPDESIKREHFYDYGDIVEYLALKYDGRRKIAPLNIVCEEPLNLLNKAYNDAFSTYQETFRQIYKLPQGTVKQMADELVEVIHPQLPRKKSTSKQSATTNEAAQLCLPGLVVVR